MDKKIVILANSRKNGGRCVAGKDESGNWVRFTRSNGNPIPVMEALQYRLLSTVEVKGLINNASSVYNYHTEDSIYNWIDVVGSLDRTLINRLLDNPINVFGSNQCLSENDAQELDYSLLFIKVTNFCMYLKDCGEYGVKLRGQFTYRNVNYTDIAVTDSSVEQRLANCNYQYRENYNEAYITVSLGEIFRGYAYKLISGVIIP